MSLNPEQRDYGQMLLRRAKGDLHACEVLADDSETDDSIIGFHSQQAVEKALKIALVTADVELPYTHDLDYLVRQAIAAGVEMPNDLREIEWLTPWAVALRYDEPEALERSAAIAVASSAVEWAEALLAKQAPGARSQGSVLSESDPTEPDETQ